MSFFRADNLVVQYRNSESPAVDGVTMGVPDGMLYAVLGPNGSGKSTLMRALLGTVMPEAGEAWLGDRRTSEWTRRDLALTVGVVSQSESIAFPMTVRELVSMGRYPHLGPFRHEGEGDRRAIGQALAWCDASHLADRSVTSLSGGEFQRVRIARALAQEPAALALDEPTASLDIRHEMTIFALLRQSADEGMTVLMTTHNLNLAARFADRILLLDRGRVAAEGHADDVLTSETLERVYRWPVAVRRDAETGALQVVPRVATGGSGRKRADRPAPGEGSGPA